MGDTEEKSSGSLPPHQLLVRCADDFALRTSSFHVRTGPLDPTSLEENKKESTNTGSEEGWLAYSQDGSVFACICNEKIEVYDSETHQVTKTLARAGVTQMHWSPLANFLVTFERKTGADGGKALCVWSMATCEVVREFHYKILDEMAWPILQWTKDEELLCHLVRNQVTVYSGKDCTSKIDTVVAKNIEHFKLSPTTAPYRLATFIPTSKSEPARVTIFDFTNNKFEQKAVKSFFKANTATINWSPVGLGVLINAKTFVDKTNESYYGESSLHMMLSDGSFSCSVPFGTNKGPVHDAQWSPQGKDFVAIQGFQPARITLFNAANCTPVRDFGQAPRNTVIFSPHGRFVCIAGFGNLAGEMDFWEKNKFKMMGTCQDLHGAKSFEWAPDGRTFITSVLWPKRRVDNGIKVWTYFGDLVYQEKIDRLAQVALRPAPEGVFPNRPMSPRLNDRRTQQSIVASQLASKPKAYIPPHLRGKPEAAPSNIMKRDACVARKLVSVEQQQQEKSNKNAKRRERQKKKKEEETAALVEEEAKAAREVSMKKDAAQREQQERLSALSPDEQLTKKAKALKKKLTQVEKLKTLKASGTDLDAAQAKKLATGPGLERELEEVTASLAALKA